MITNNDQSADDPISPITDDRLSAMMNDLSSMVDEPIQDLQILQQSITTAVPVDPQLDLVEFTRPSRHAEILYEEAELNSTLRFQLQATQEEARGIIIQQMNGFEETTLQLQQEASIQRDLEMQQ